MAIYRLFHWWWNPILRDRPDWREIMIAWLKSSDVLDEGENVVVTVTITKVPPKSNTRTIWNDIRGE